MIMMAPKAAMLWVGPHWWGSTASIWVTHQESCLPSSVPKACSLLKWTPSLWPI